MNILQRYEDEGYYEHYLREERFLEEVAAAVFASLGWTVWVGFFSHLLAS